MSKKHRILDSEGLRLRILVAAMCALVTVEGLTRTAQGTTSDDEAICARIAAMEAALNRRDAEGYADQYALDGDFATPFSFSAGREAIRQEAENVFRAMPAEVRNTLSVTEVRFLEADVALAEVDVAPTGGRATYVMHRSDDEWLIAAGRILPPVGSPPE